MARLASKIAPKDALNCSTLGEAHLGLPSGTLGASFLKMLDGPFLGEFEASGRPKLEWKD